MTDQATPAKVRLTDGVGPLPEARWKWAGNGPRPYEDAYSADQMRAYAEHAVARERQRTMFARRPGLWALQAREVLRLADALKADAERYRWLVARPCDGEDEFYISAKDSKQASEDGWWALGGDMAKEQADAYIDAAMKGTQ